jgi:hypothetical protein
MKSIKLSFLEIQSLLSGMKLNNKTLVDPEYYAVDDFVCLGKLKKGDDGYILEAYDNPSIIKVKTYSREIETKYIPDIEIKKLSDYELEYMHSYSHAMAKHTSSKEFCKLHFSLANQMYQRNLYHFGNEPCDRVVEVIKQWRIPYSENISIYSSKALEYDKTIVSGWITYLSGNSELYRKFNNETKKITLNDCNIVISDINNELLKRRTV